MRQPKTGDNGNLHARKREAKTTASSPPLKTDFPRPTSHPGPSRDGPYKQQSRNQQRLVQVEYEQVSVRRRLGRNSDREDRPTVARRRLGRNLDQEGTVKDLELQHRLEIVPPVVKNSEPPYRREIVPPLVKAAESQHHREIVSPIVKDSEPPHRREIVPPLVKDSEPQRRREIVPPILKDSDSRLRHERVPPIAVTVPQLSEERPIVKVGSKPEARVLLQPQVDLHRGVKRGPEQTPSPPP